MAPLADAMGTAARDVERELREFMTRYKGPA